MQDVPSNVRMQRLTKQAQIWQIYTHMPLPPCAICAHAPMQGPLLEANKVDIGVVTAIAAPAALNIFFHGDGGHGGALLMPYRCAQLLIIL